MTRFQSADMKLYYDKPEALSAAISGERRGIVNREILFRGKRIDTGEWIEGYFGQSVDTFIIQDYGLVAGHFKVFKVVPETVGQYTGLKDKNGKKIFEGDILKHYDKTTFGEPVGDWGFVKWDCDECMLFRTSTRIGKDRLVTSHDIYEVVGNIHDNPELLEVSDDNG